MDVAIKQKGKSEDTNVEVKPTMERDIKRKMKK